jgi:hypothetical protein
LEVHVSPACGAAADHIELSNGTRLPDDEELDGGYEEGARLPREPWRLPTKREVAGLLVARPPRDRAGSVSIVRLPGGLSEARKNLLRDGSREAVDVDILPALRTACVLDGPLSYLSRASNVPGLATVTVNREIRRLIGLHVDNWENLAIERRDQAANRISINIGETDRYFLFMPYPLMDMVRVLFDELGAGWVLPERFTLIGRLFMERFADVPVIRCRLAPGEAYIAPTENLVHDGSTAGQHEPDLHLTYTGRISAAPGYPDGPSGD